MMIPDSAITIFLPTVLLQKRVARFTDPSQGDRRHWLAHGVRALRERGALVVGERHLEDLFEAAATELAGHAQEYPLVSVLALQPRGARQDALPIEGDCLAHLHGRRGWRVVGRTGLEILHDLAASTARTLDDRVQLSLVEQLRHRNPAHAR